ncbi:MBL fold metallo-hydrolase [Streptomyces sp. MS19]|uniref:MBL fold metallo-hydrolase n=1 Tax=Streptomyces sp. MS19 TaxID=3385972 RepID=UPI0039A086BB
MSSTSLSYAVHTAGGPGLNKASVLVMGDREALLVDGQFTVAEQHRVVAAVLDSGKRLTTVFVSAPDPDCYFGLEVVAAAFPDARIVAMPGTVERIAASWAEKRETWRNLGPNLATDIIVPEAMTGTTLDLEGRTFEVRGGDPADPALAARTQYLWQPEDRALLGGVLLFAGLHVWTADTRSPEERADWDRTLAEAQGLQPGYVVPGHRAPDTATDASAIAFTRAYLAAFDEELARTDGAAPLADAMRRRFPGLDGMLNLDLGAKVATGEMSWR